ncbi:hypothetical protein NMG60_11004661 [Bertholletia excelsa]
MAGVQVKQEIMERVKLPEANRKPEPSNPIAVIDLSSSDSDDSVDLSSSSDDDGSATGVDGKRSRASSDGAEGGSSEKKKKKKKKKTIEELNVALPPGFLDPLPGKNIPTLMPPPMAVSAFQPTRAADDDANVRLNRSDNTGGCKQFWKAGDYEGVSSCDRDKLSGGMDHVRVHPKFLHSNATSHKWVLGAFAELLDNALDEVRNGATFVNIDMLYNRKDGSRMLLIEDNGGGMDPDKMRQCMSLGYSAKNKLADTIGQYGNGFKTSTMRLGADVIVFSRCRGKDGNRPTQSIGLLSYTFLRNTGKEDIVVPMLDYERGGLGWSKMKRSSGSDWKRNLETIVHWSPFSSEADMLEEFNKMKDRGTRVIIYNLWEDDQGQLELDFGTDPHDIQIRGVNRDEKKIQMAKQYPNSKHFLTYRHSLRSYASILYLRIPTGFRIILRGKDIEHHNVVNDMMMTQEITYRPQPGVDGVPKESNMVAVVTIGFVKDAKFHIDVQGFNVYHKNRLIKPFWRLWNATGIGGRGVIGVLEANFVEPAHDKQGFERTTVLSRLEGKLIQMQKSYWRAHCHKIGYAQNRNKSQIDDKGLDKLHSQSNLKKGIRASDRCLRSADKTQGNGHAYTKGGNRANAPEKSGKGQNSSEQSSPSEEDTSDDEIQTAQAERQANTSSQKVFPASGSFMKDSSHLTKSPLNMGNMEAEQVSSSDRTPVIVTTSSRSKEDDVGGNNCTPSNAIDQLKEENQWLRERLKRKEEDVLIDLVHNLQYEKDKCKSLETKLEEATRMIKELNKEQESLIDIFAEERKRRDTEEENLRKKLKDASNTIQDLLDKVTAIEKMKSPSN